jgi:hypothetical protein
MQAHHQSRGRPWAAAILAGAAVLGCPEVSHAHSPDAFVVTVVTPFGHATLLPAYVSIIYYAAASEKKMHLGWTFPNLVSSAATASLGILELSLLARSSSHEASYVAAGSLVAGAAVVVTATILQTIRSPERSSSLVFLPTIGAPGGLGSGAGAVVAGTF